MNTNKISNILVKTDYVLDLVPVLGSVTNLVDLFLKCAIIPCLSKSTVKESRYWRHLNQKSFSICLASIFLPVIANIGLAFKYYKDSKRRALAQIKLAQIHLKRKSQKPSQSSTPKQAPPAVRVQGRRPINLLLRNALPTIVEVDEVDEVDEDDEDDENVSHRLQAYGASAVAPPDRSASHSDVDSTTARTDDAARSPNFLEPLRVSALPATPSNDDEQLGTTTLSSQSDEVMQDATQTDDPRWTQDQRAGESPLAEALPVAQTEQAGVWRHVTVLNAFAITTLVVGSFPITGPLGAAAAGLGGSALVAEAGCAIIANALRV